jgi:hypothetical protein
VPAVQRVMNHDLASREELDVGSAYACVLDLLMVEPIFGWNHVERLSHASVHRMLERIAEAETSSATDSSRSALPRRRAWLPCRPVTSYDVPG